MEIVICKAWTVEIILQNPFNRTQLRREGRGESGGGGGCLQCSELDIIVLDADVVYRCNFLPLLSNAAADVAQNCMACISIC